MAIVEKPIPGVAELVQHLLQPSPGRVRWFRGQGCERRSLKPSLPRRLSPFAPDQLLESERRLITRFRQRSVSFWPEGYPQIDWEQLFAMQHFGVPTRLLDWSENALIAAYFAADHDPSRCECQRLNSSEDKESDSDATSCKPTVWVLDPVALNKHNSRLDGMPPAVLATSDTALNSWEPGMDETRFAPWPVALYGTHNSPRIVAQQGTFTVAGKEDKGLEESPAVTNHDEVLQKLTLDAPHGQIKAELATLGVTKGTVFPDLVGLSHDITESELTNVLA